MHYFHRIVVEAEDEDGAISASEEALESYQDTAFDYHTVGGRWDKQLGGYNVIRYTEHSDVFRQQLEEAAAAQNAEYLRFTRMVSGKPFTLEEVPSHITSDLEKLGESHGAAASRSEEWLARSNESLREDHAKMQALLTSPSLAQAEAGDMMSAFYLKALAKLVGGDYTSDSHFLHATVDGDRTASPANLLALIAEDANHKELQDLWMVGYDLHN
jgi:hypothetical protein